MLDEVGWWLALGLANLAAILDPACFVLGGGLVGGERRCCCRRRAATSSGCSRRGSGARRSTVVAAELGTRAGAIGAALLAADGLVRLGVLLPTFRTLAGRRARRGRRGGDASASTASSPTTTSGRWARPTGPRSRRSRCSPPSRVRQPGPRRRPARRARRARRRRRAARASAARCGSWRTAGSSSALGTGDRLSRAENLAYGVPVRARPTSAGRRCARVADDARTTRASEVWIGDGAPATRADRGRRRLHPQPLGRDAAERRRGRRALGPVSWAGPAPARDGAVDEARDRELLDALAAAGATWAVFAPQVPIEPLAEARWG